MVQLEHQMSAEMVQDHPPTPPGLLQLVQLACQLVCELVQVLPLLLAAPGHWLTDHLVELWTEDPENKRLHNFIIVRYLLNMRS